MRIAYGSLTKAQNEKASVLREIQATSVAKLHPGLDEGGLLKELVAQYLIHEGYVETAKSFVAEVESDQASLGKNSAAMITRSTTEDDRDASNRQRKSYPTPGPPRA